MNFLHTPSPYYALHTKLLCFFGVFLTVFFFFFDFSGLMERDTDFFFDFSGLMERDTDKAAWMLKLICIFNPIALKTAKTRWSFGHFECNRVQDYT